MVVGEVCLLSSLVLLDRVDEEQSGASPVSHTRSVGGGVVRLGTHVAVAEVSVHHVAVVMADQPRSCNGSA